MLYFSNILFRKLSNFQTFLVLMKLLCSSHRAKIAVYVSLRVHEFTWWAVNYLENRIETVLNGLNSLV